MRPALALPAAALLGLAACISEPPPVASDDFQTFCATCHGPGGKGDGILAASLNPRPADLTKVSARHGGTFPTTYVMSVIDGYTRGEHGSGVTGPMPEFGAILQGREVLYDDGSGGRPVPVPERLLNLANYVESLQQ